MLRTHNGEIGATPGCVTRQIEQQARLRADGILCFERGDLFFLPRLEAALGGAQRLYRPGRVVGSPAQHDRAVEQLAEPLLKVWPPKGSRTINRL